MLWTRAVSLITYRFKNPYKYRVMSSYIPIPNLGNRNSQTFITRINNRRLITLRNLHLTVNSTTFPVPRITINSPGGSSTRKLLSSINMLMVVSNSLILILKITKKEIISSNNGGINEQPWSRSPWQNWPREVHHSCPALPLLPNSNYLLLKCCRRL